MESSSTTGIWLWLIAIIKAHDKVKHDWNDGEGIRKDGIAADAMNGNTEIMMRWKTRLEVQRNDEKDHIT